MRLSSHKTVPATGIAGFGKVRLSKANLTKRTEIKQQENRASDGGKPILKSQSPSILAI